MLVAEGERRLVKVFRRVPGVGVLPPSRERVGTESGGALPGFKTGFLGTPFSPGWSPCTALGCSWLKKFDGSLALPSWGRPSLPNVRNLITLLPAWKLLEPTAMTRTL